MEQEFCIHPDWSNTKIDNYWQMYIWNELFSIIYYGANKTKATRKLLGSCSSAAWLNDSVTAAIQYILSLPKCWLSEYSCTIHCTRSDLVCGAPETWDIHICGVVANYLVTQARDPGINSHLHHPIHDIYGTIWGKILCLSSCNLSVDLILWSNHVASLYELACIN